MKIVFDFDHTLFSAKKFYFALKKAFLKLGIDEKLFQETFEKSKGKERNYKPKIQFKLIKKIKPKISAKKLERTFKKVLKEAPKFLYPDTTWFLKKWQNKANLILLSYGDKEFQMEKIKASQIEKFFKKIIITREIEKLKSFRKIFTINEKTFFVEDNPQALLKVKKIFKNTITVRINRKEGKYFRLPDNPQIDFSIKNLNELQELLKKIQKKPKGLLLFSGGLDSILAGKLLQKQGIKIVGITFKSFFFGEKQAEKSAKEINLPLKVIDFSEEHLKIVKNPKYGYGKAMNPCLDCHILMLKKAKEVMKEEGFDFVATGEVLGERPMSQNRKALEIVEKESSLKGYLLRPLSAKLLPKTIPEKLKLIERNELLDIRGRSRRRQMELAEKFKIKEYPTPAGGCLLTDLEFGKRLKELLKIYPKAEGNDIELLKIGRHFFEKKVKIVIGRNEEENKKIKKLAKKGDILIEMKNYPGPTTLIRNYKKGKILEKIIEKAKYLTQFYSKKAREKKDIIFNIKEISS